MAVFSRIKTWVSNEVLTASDLNAEFNNLLNNTIPASIEDYSSNASEMQTVADPGAVGTESLATTLAGEITRLRFAIKRIVGGAQWYSAPVIDLGSTISAADIASDAVTTAKILDANVTRAKLGAVGQQSSSDTGVLNLAITASLTDITNLSISITTTGRPVVLMLLPDENISGTLPGIRPNASDSILIFSRDGAEIGATYRLTAYSGNPYHHGATFMYLDTPAAGTYTYKARARTFSGSDTLSVYYMKLVAYEL